MLTTTGPLGTARLELTLCKSVGNWVMSSTLTLAGQSSKVTICLGLSELIDEHTRKLTSKVSLAMNNLEVDIMIG